MFKRAGKILLTLLLAAGLLSCCVMNIRRLEQTVRDGSKKIAEAGGAAIQALQNLEKAGSHWVSAATAKQLTFLLTGIDDAMGGSDVIMLASLDIEAGSIRVIQIPRDTYINRSDSSNHKLNSVYAAAAADAIRSGQSEVSAAHTANRALVAFLQKNLGITIDHYVSIRTDGLRKIVDAIGGVTVHVPTDIDYDDESQDLHIHLKAGRQLLDGKKAEEFVRFRSGYLTADYGRMDAQKIFLSALFGKIRNELSLTSAINLATTCYRSIQSDLSLADLIPLVRVAMQISADNVKMITLKGQSAKDENGVLCEVLSREHTIDLLADYLLPRGSRSSDLQFDPNGVFTAPGKIDEIYRSRSPYGKNGIRASEADQIRIR